MRPMKPETDSPFAIHPVILCGGIGSRLWPLSRKQKPKPFLPLLGPRSLFEQAIGRVAEDAGFSAPMIVAAEVHADLIEAQMGRAADYRLVVEPCARNTAPAIALAAALLPRDAIMLVCPSDHHIADEAAFRRAAKAAARLAAGNHLIAFGIAATHPETGYGYIQQGAPLDGGFVVAKFFEKPDLARAQEYVASGDYCWNGGIFAFRAGHLLDELAQHRPMMAELVARAAADGRQDGTRFHPAAAAFAAIAGESIDYAVMENTATAAMVPVEMGWSDIGNFAALQDALAAMPQHDDAAGNVVLNGHGDIDLDGCRNVLAISDGPRISAIGLENLCIIVAGNEVVVTTRNGAQAVGKLPGAVNQ